jgi:hypothetical protein
VGEREGPVAGKLSCHGCRHYCQERYSVQGDSGYDKSCAYFSPARDMDEYGGTPDWCPFRDPRLTASNAALRAECERLKAENERYRTDLSGVSQRLYERTCKVLDEAGIADDTPAIYDRVRVLAQRLAAVTAERDLAQHKLSTLAEQHTATEAELRTAKAALAAVHAGPDFVWFWQGHGDHLGSLSCPVVMESETLRGITADRDRMRPVYEAAVEWSESFGELSKRLPPHVHKLRAAVDTAIAASADKGAK